MDKIQLNPFVSVVGAPVAVVAGHQAAGDEEDQIYEPPDPEASQGEQLADSGASVAQTETVDPKTTQEEGVQQRGNEVVPSVSVQNQTKDIYNHISDTAF